MSTAGTNLVPEPETETSSYYLVGLADEAMARVDETSSVGFQAIVELRGAIDHTAMREAWGRLAALHPILTCVREGTAWRPTGPPPMGEEEMQPGHDEPPIALRVTPLSDGQRLTVMCNHVAFDGVASVILLSDLRDEYEAVLRGGPTRPTDWSPRTLEAAAVGAGWRTAATAAVRGASSWWRASVSTHVDPGPLSERPAENHAVFEIGPVLEALTPARHRYHWSVDAVLIGVLEKAWADVFGPARAESTWLVARDLRPALGWTRGIGNLSMAAGVSIPDPTSDVTMVIDRAEAALATQNPDLVTAALPLSRWRPAAGATFASMLRRSGRLRAFRSVSNVGQLGDSLDDWGAASMRRVWFVGPLARPPYNSFIAAGHGPSTLVSVRTSPTWLTEDHARAMEQAVLALV